MPKRVLLISFYFPPRPGIGSVRPGGLAKYLLADAWTPTVITGQCEDRTLTAFPYRVVETPFVDRIVRAKRMLGMNPMERTDHAPGTTPPGKFDLKRSTRSLASAWVRALLTYPDEYYGWYKSALAAGRKILSEEKTDLLFTSSSPVTCHLIGAQLKKEFGIPWVADLRDLWSQNHYRDPKSLWTKLHRRLERKTFSGVDCLTTVSEPWSDRLRQLHTTVPVRCVVSGFDPDLFPSPILPPRNSKFTITHAGSLYDGKRDPSMLFEVVNRMVACGAVSSDEIEMNFYGDQAPWVMERARGCGVDRMVKVHGTVSRARSLELQAHSDLLLLLLWDNPEEVGTIPGKIFEYLGIRRPILAFGGPPGSVGEILRITSAGLFSTSVGEATAYLDRLIRQWRDKGLVPCIGAEALHQYTHKYMAHAFAEIFDEVAAKPKSVLRRG